MSIYGFAKGTELEKLAATAAQGEANGVMLYYSLARLAREQGLDELEPVFMELADQEAVHAGFFAVLNGQYPQNFWELVANLQKLEEKGEEKYIPLAAKVREMGCPEAADEIELFARQEAHHGVVLANILKKYAPQALDITKEESR